MLPSFMSWASGTDWILERFTGIGGTNSISLKARVFFTLCPLLIHLGLSPELFAKSIVYEFVRK